MRAREGERRRGEEMTEEERTKAGIRLIMGWHPLFSREKNFG